MHHRHRCKGQMKKALREATRQRWPHSADKTLFLLLLALFNLAHVLKMVRASAVDLNLWPFEMLAVFVSESVSSRHPPKQIFIGA